MDLEAYLKLLRMTKKDAEERYEATKIGAYKVIAERIDNEIKEIEKKLKKS